MSQNAPLSAFSMHFFSSKRFDINTNLTCKSARPLKQQFIAMKHRIGEKTNTTALTMPKQYTGALSK